MELNPISTFKFIGGILIVFIGLTLLARDNANASSYLTIGTFLILWGEIDGKNNHTS